MKTKRYNVIGLGGTFDHFHAGHEKFINFASDLSDLLVIGITNQTIAGKKTYPHLIESFAERSRSVEYFCNSLGIHFEIIELSDSIGSTVSDNRIEALAVTTETIIGGDQINKLRRERGLAPLPLYVCDLLPSSDGQPLHSDRIRAGECDRKGLIYLDLFKQTIKFSAKQRLLLAKPQGPIVDQPNFISDPHFQPHLIILVGDSTIEKFIANNWPFNIGVYDRRIQRHQAHDITLELKPDLNVNNPAGSITPNLVESIRSLLRFGSVKPKYLLVDGEEDLAVIPAVMLAPLGSVVYYGQPKVGLVEICVSEKQKMNFNSTIFQETH